LIFPVVACLLFHHLRRRTHPDIIESIIREAVVIEKEFLSEALPVSLIGVSLDIPLCLCHSFVSMLIQASLPAHYR
jgi:ribonucleoside-diphosphate reductase subunit M2